MTLYAFTLSPDVRAELLFLVYLTFWLYVLLSFIAVSRYVAKKIKTGRLINGRASPLSFLIPPAGKWLFVLNFLTLLLMPSILARPDAPSGHTPMVPDFVRMSVLYRAVVLTGLLVLFAMNIRGAKDRNRMPQAAGWLFALNVIALLLMQSPLYMILVVTGLAVLLIESERTAQVQFGLERLEVSQLVKWSLLICGAVIFVADPLMLIFQGALNTLHLSHPEQQTVQIFRQYTNPSLIVDFMIQAVLIAPMIEELFFRGFLLTFLKNCTPTWLAIVLSAALFAVAHQNLDSVLPLLVLGIVLGVAYEHTGSILLPMGIHACFNLTTGLTLLAQKVSS